MRTTGISSGEVKQTIWSKITSAKTRAKKLMEADYDKVS